MQCKNSVSSLRLTPMTAEEAAKLVDRMLGSYPYLSPHDPETYIANLITLLCGYPLWAGERATTAVKRATKHLPTEADLYPALEDQVRAHRYAAEWEHDAERALEGRLLEGPPRVKESYEDLKAKYGEGWGIRNPDEEVRKSVYRTADQLRAEFGAAFDAVPDAYTPWTKVSEAAE